MHRRTGPTGVVFDGTRRLIEGHEDRVKQPSQAKPVTKHVILFLAANPRDTDRLAPDQEARSIRLELKRSGYRDRVWG